MVATLTHFVYGLLMWEVTGRTAPIWAALLLSQLLDFDFGIGLLVKNKYEHRRYFHNIFSFSFFILISSYFFGFLFSFLVLGSHFIMDLFDMNGIHLFYPFSKKKYLIKKVGRVKNLPKKLYWDGTWWFYGIAALIYLVFLLVK